MVREFARTDRIADAIQRILATVITREVRDPRIGMININDVTVTRDIAHAKVFVTFVDKEKLGSDDEYQESIKALNHAAGFLRGIVAKELNTRVVPRLHFFYDKTAIRGQQLMGLIDRAVAENVASPTVTTLETDSD